ncbi:cobalt transporter CbiM [Desulfothermus naphthae]
MHISEGVLTPPILIAGAAITLTGTVIGLKKIRPYQVPLMAVLTSAFFVASLIHVPLGPTSVHLVLNGLLGILLGFGAFPSILVALLLQAIFFQFGGIIVLGANTANMALPALIVFLLFKNICISEQRKFRIIGGFLSGSISILLSGVMVALCLYFCGENFSQAAKTILVAHIPIMIIEGIITGVTIDFIYRVKPEMLDI